MACPVGLRARLKRIRRWVGVLCPELFRAQFQIHRPPHRGRRKKKMYEAKIVVLAGTAQIRATFTGIRSWEEKFSWENFTTEEELDQFDEMGGDLLLWMGERAKDQATCEWCGFIRTENRDPAFCNCGEGMSPLALFAGDSIKTPWEAESVSGGSGHLRVSRIEPENYLGVRRVELRLIFQSKGGSLLAAVKAAGWTVYGF